MHTSRSPRLLPTVLTALLVIGGLTALVHAGGGPVIVRPEGLGPDWATVRVALDGDIVQALSRIPQDPNPLGVRAAHIQTSLYPASFGWRSFPAADGTPLAGRIALHRDNRPRPGIVLVPGLAQTKDLKFIVELAELFSRNGWDVLTIDLRGHGESRKLSPAMTTLGWKETDDVLGAARYLREQSGAASVAVMGFSLGGRSLVKAMAQDCGQLIDAGIAVTAPLAAWPRFTRPAPGFTPNRVQKFLLDFHGTPSLYEYYDRAARSYGVDLQTLETQTIADTSIARVKKPLLMLYSLEDFQTNLQIRSGRHDGGNLSLA